MDIAHPAASRGYLSAIFAGLAASLVGIGLARFAYSPLLPAMIHDHWFAATEVAFLGAANLAGYLIGALSGRALARYASPVRVLRLTTLLASVSFLACAFPLSETWFFCWRLLSGVAGGVIMVLVSGVVLHRVPRHKKGIASGAIFFGVGLGVAISGTLVPAMLTISLQAAWLALGALSLALTALSWSAWPDDAHTQVRSMSAMKKAPASRPLNILFVQYALAAAGLVPEMMFLVDYVARALGHGTGLGAVAWIAYGVGAMAGPVLYGMAADRWGARRSIVVALAVQAIAAVALVFSGKLLSLIGLAVVIGSFPAGVVPLGLGRLHDLVEDAHQREAMWSRLTVAFALAQAIGGYFYSGVYAWTGGRHEVTFWIGGMAFAAALALTPWTREAKA
ncbi:YbfB/YjiJ family MFS transporter [Herbaspirillum sp.]|uniref:YbfB/YjiJ family MFS transporter n=1 Tax=Herbaspirillum sp. TaxID=1890675 RepID=UPI0031DCCD7E